MTDSVKKSLPPLERFRLYASKRYVATNIGTGIEIELRSVGNVWQFHAYHLWSGTPILTQSEFDSPESAAEASIIWFRGLFSHFVTFCAPFPEPEESEETGHTIEP